MKDLSISIDVRADSPDEVLITDRAGDNVVLNPEEARLLVHWLNQWQENGAKVLSLSWKE